MVEPTTRADHRVPLELIPATRQTFWGMPAVLNFTLGGLGAGFHVAAVVAAAVGAPAAMGLATWLGPALVLAGLAAVATEAGRPRRGVRVLTRLATSWMSREAWLAGAFVVLAAAEWARPAPVLRGLTAAVALAFVLAQGWLVRRARGVVAWDVAAMPALFLVSALLSGGGLLLVVDSVTGRNSGAPLLVAALVLTVLGMVLWIAYLAWSTDPVFVDAVRPLSRGGAAFAIVAAGYVVPFVLVAVALALAWPVAAGAAGALMIAGQAAAKWTLILDAGALRPITLTTLRLSRRPS